MGGCSLHHSGRCVDPGPFVELGLFRIGIDLDFYERTYPPTSALTLPITGYKEHKEPNSRDLTSRDDLLVAEIGISALAIHQHNFFLHLYSGDTEVEPYRTRHVALFKSREVDVTIT